MEEISLQTGGWTISGSADESEERKTTNLPSHSAAGDFTASNYAGRHIRFGLRHQSMFAIANGIAGYGSFLPILSLRLPLLPLVLPSLSLTALSRHPMLLFLLSDHPADPPYSSPSSSQAPSPSISPLSSISISQSSYSPSRQSPKTSSSSSTQISSSSKVAPLSPSSLSKKEKEEGSEKTANHSKGSFRSYGVPGCGGWTPDTITGDSSGGLFVGGNGGGGLFTSDEWMARAAMMIAGEMGREGRLLFFRPADGDELLSSLSISLADPLRRPAVFSISSALPSSSSSSSPSITSMKEERLEEDELCCREYGGVDKGGYIVFDRAHPSSPPSSVQKFFVEKSKKLEKGKSKEKEKEKGKFKEKGKEKEKEKAKEKSKGKDKEKGKGKERKREEEEERERDIILIASGDDVEKCISAAQMSALKSLRVRVISVPSVYLLSQQPIEYLLNLFPHSSPVLSIDSSAASSFFSPFAHFSLSLTSSLPTPTPSLTSSHHSSHSSQQSQSQSQHEGHQPHRGHRHAHQHSVVPPSSSLSLGEAGRWGLEGVGGGDMRKFTAEMIAVKSRETFDRFLSLFPSDRRSLLSPVVFSSFSPSQSSIPYF